MTKPGGLEQPPGNECTCGNWHSAHTAGSGAAMPWSSRLGHGLVLACGAVLQCISTFSSERILCYIDHPNRQLFQHSYTAECDIPVPGIPGTGNFSFFWWYRNRYRKKIVPEKSLGTGIGKIRYRKKVSEPVSDFFFFFWNRRSHLLNWVINHGDYKPHSIYQDWRRSF